MNENNDKVFGRYTITETIITSLIIVFIAVAAFYYFKSRKK